MLITKCEVHTNEQRSRGSAVAVTVVGVGVSFTYAPVPVVAEGPDRRTWSALESCTNRETNSVV